MHKRLNFMQNLVYITFFENFKKNVYNRNFLWYYITNDRCFSTGCLPQSHNIRQFKHLSFFLQTKCLQAKCLATCPLSCVSVISTIDTRSTTSQMLANQMFDVCPLRCVSIISTTIARSTSKMLGGSD